MEISNEQLRRRKKPLLQLLALYACIYAGLYVNVASGQRVREDRRNAGRAEGDATTSDTWKVNRAICPPVLCGPEPGPVSGGDDERAKHRSRSPGPIMAEPMRVPPPDGGGSTRGEGAGGAAFPFFEGDIVLDDFMSARLARAKSRALSRARSRERSRSRARSSSRQRTRSRSKRSIVRPVSRLWKFGIIPYIIDQNLPDKTKYYIERSIRHIENQTCLTFRWRNETTDPDYLYFINQPGCWSYVGRRGGAQYVSLGYGCSYFGTALHETTHAIGFWHEQSRLDRDEYVKVLTANLAPSGVDQFGIRQKTESTSRGFAYDYGSITHYGSHYFSSNGKATLKVIGVGETLGLKIGQRRGLSDLDVAQLRDMYHCNEKDAEKRECKSGWKKFGKSCYLFVTSPREQYGRAERACREHGARLLGIETKEEDDFIKSTLIGSYKNWPAWRTGGRQRADKWVWYDRSSKRQKELNYTSWAPNFPGRFSTHILVRFDGSPPRYVWRATLPGSKSQQSRFAHSYICETKTKEECVVSRRKGRNYRGTINYTMDGFTCQKWTAQYPHKHDFLRGSRKATDEGRNGLGDHNYCRNPDSGNRKRPWCFTNLTARRWQYCDVKVVTDKCD